MDIELWKNKKKELNLTFDELSDITGISRRQLLYLFNGNAKNPGVDTVQRIEKALGIAEQPPTMSEQEKQLSDLIMQLTEDEVKELSSFVDYILSKRK